MPTRRFLLLVTSAFVVTILQAGGGSSPAPAQTLDALGGRVTSAEEGAMEGVVVSARKDGSIVTVSVVSDHQGRYRFPRARLEPGKYALSIRAVGYELAGPGTASIAAEEPAVADLRLRRVQDITPQLTNGEWITSVPGTSDQKKFLYGCVGCHTLERVVKSRHNAAAYLKVMARMAGYSNNSHADRPQLRVRPRDLARNFGPDAEKQAAFLASINLSSGPWTYSLQTYPRVKGKGTRVIITEYDLPRKSLMPHDVIVDPEGIAWFSSFNEQLLGRFDLKTLTYTEFPIPVQRPDYPKGTLDLETDPQGNLWLSHMFQTGVVKFDKKTRQFQAWPLPTAIANDESQQSMVGPQRWTVDGKVWLNDAGLPGLHRLDLATGAFETWEPYKDMKPPHSVYGIYADSKNNIWFMDFGGENVGKIDAATGKVSLFPTPTPRSRPRRGRMDDEDRVWFAEWRAEKLGMFDTRTEQFREWPVPTLHTAPYDAVLDRNNQLWSAGMNTDRVLRMDVASGQFVEFQLPRQTNIRRIFVDNSTTPPTFWVGSNHASSVIRLEPLE